jgi:hypothetical protein
MSGLGGGVSCEVVLMQTVMQPVMQPVADARPGQTPD